MNLTVNGSRLEVPAGTHVAALLEQMRLGGQRLAVEVNGEIVLRSGYAGVALHEGDRVEIVQAIGGG